MQRKRSVAVNLKIASGRDIVKDLITSADVLIDPFRPGVMEKLGLGPEVFIGQEGLNRRLIYARVVGWVAKSCHDLQFSSPFQVCEIWYLTFFT